MWHHTLVLAAQGRRSDRVLIEDLPSAASGTQPAEAAIAGPLYRRGSRGSELRSPCHNPAVLPPCPQGGAEPLPLGPATTSPTLSLQYPQPLHPLGTHMSQACARISPHYVSPPLIPTSSCLCGNATSSRKRPPPHADRLRLLGQLPANQYSSLHSPSCAVLPSIFSHPSPLLLLTMDSPRSGKGSGPSHRILPPGGSSPMRPRGEAFGPGSERNLHACAPHPWPGLTWL